MASLSTKLPWELAAPKWSSQLNPILAIPMLSGNEIDGIKLIANKPQAIAHLLQKMPQGWFLLDNIANTVVWRAAAFTQLYITLQSSVDTTISIWVF
jgi:hypothetical protein